MVSPIKWISLYKPRCNVTKNHRILWEILAKDLSDVVMAICEEELPEHVIGDIDFKNITHKSVELPYICHCVF